MIFDANEFASAILLFDDDGELAHQMQLAEFQAVLAGYVALEELAGTTAKAVYVEFDNQYHAQRLVFFLLPIAPTGQVSSGWLLPLADIAAEAGKHKDLGGGAVRLACYSQCPIPHLRTHLWDPDFSPRNNQLTKVKRAIKENKIGIAFRDQPNRDNSFSEVDRAQMEQELSTRLRKEYAQEFRDHMAQLLKEQRLRIASTREESRQEIVDIKLGYEADIRELTDRLNEAEQNLREQELVNQQLREVEVSHAKKIEAIRCYYEDKLTNTQVEGESFDEAQRFALEAELQAKFDAEVRDLRESLQTREVELLYRNELEVQLHDEIARLREQNQLAMANTGEQLLLRLVECGISLVSFQPGAGHLTIPLNEISSYLDDPSAYAASQCNVSSELYSEWLRHYRMPVCENKLDDDRDCGENIDRVENPIDFKPGESNCCANCRKKLARAHLKLAGE